MVVVARTDEVATLSRQLATVQQQAQEHERTRGEVMRLSKEIEKLKGVIAEHPESSKRSPRRRSSPRSNGMTCRGRSTCSRAW